MSNITTPVYHVAMDPETYISVIALMKRKEEAKLKAREKYRAEQEVKLNNPEYKPRAHKESKPKFSKFVVTKISYDEPVAEVSAKLENLKLENTL